jgi:rod shape-determining protein MreD
MLLIVLAWAVVRGLDEGLVWGFVGGLIIDLLSGGPLGANILALLAVAFLAGQPWGRRVGSSVIRLGLLALLCVVVYHLILLIVLVWTGHSVDWVEALLRVAIPSAILNAPLAPFIQRPMAWLERRTRQERFAL